MAEIPHLLVHHPKDNVGVVVLEGLAAGTDMVCVVTADNSDFRLTVNAAVPIGHKVALRDLHDGDTVVKYGEDVGRIVADVSQGWPRAHPQHENQALVGRRDHECNAATCASLGGGARTAGSACATTC